MFSHHRFARFVPVVLALASSVQADDRQETTPTAAVWYYNQTPAQVTNLVNQGFRITDLEVVDTSPWRYSVAMVENTGVYAKGWWYLVNVTGATLGNFISQNNARVIDLEVFEINGQTRLAAVMIPNTGSDQKAWWWLYNTTSANIGNFVGANTARIVDLEHYRINGQTYYAAVMISNTGQDARGWSWWLNVDSAFVAGKVGQLSSRVYDLERSATTGGRYNAVLVDNTGQLGISWWYYYGLTATGVSDYLGQNGARLIDLEQYPTLNGTRFNVVMVNNSNALTTRVGSQLRGSTDGWVGVYLKEVNAGVRAYLNGDRRHEPASMLKTLHHVHAMRQVYANGVALNSPTTVYTTMSGSCPTGGGAISEPLETVLRLMMENSDNARTHAVTTRFGMSNINATGAVLGMTNTDINHHIGCGTPANWTTLVDIGKLHERVVNGYLGAQRQKFYDLMANNFETGYARGELGTVLAQEAANVGLTNSEFQAFKNAMAIAYKPGGYSVAGRFYRTWGAWIRIPFYQNGGRVDREYVTGSFVAGATNEPNAIDAAARAAGEVLRDEIRAAMTSCKNYVPGSYLSYGSGCLGSNGTPLQSGGGVPDIGENISYHLRNALPGTSGMFMLGFSKTNMNGFRLPFHLALVGANGCYLWNDPLFTFNVTTGRAGTSQFNMKLPASPRLIGAEYHTGFLVFDRAANLGGIVTSNGVTTSIGGVVR